MDPVWWLAIGSLGAAALLAGGYFEGRRGRGAQADEREALLEDQRDDFAAQVAELLEQGPAGAEAARIVVESARRSAAARRSADPRERHRLLLGGTQPDDTPAPSPPGGEA